MDKDLEYYLNNLRSNCCIPKELNKCLIKQNYLSEFSTDEEKAVARINLGITEKLDELKALLDSSVISRQDVAWDFVPTKGHTNHVLSSDALYKEFSKYALKENVEASINELWLNLVTRINASASSIEEINQNIILLQTDNQDILRCMIRDEMIPYYHKYFRLKKQFEDLQQQFNTYVQTSENGIVISNKFGNSDDVTVSQKTLTEALNKLYEKLAEYTGEISIRPVITITPDYCVTEDDYEVTITVDTTSSMFDSIKIYANNELVIELTNVRNYTYNYTIDESTTFRVETVLIGKPYSEEKTVNVYYPFFIGAGLTVDDILIPENSIEYDGNLQGRYSVTVNTEGDKFFIVIPKTKLEDVGRIHMNGYDIPFSFEEEDEYIIYESRNAYKAGTYTIYIQNL